MKDKKNDVNIFNFPAKKYSSWIFDETSQRLCWLFVILIQMLSKIFTKII